MVSGCKTVPTIRNLGLSGSDMRRLLDTAYESGGWWCFRSSVWKAPWDDRALFMHRLRSVALRAGYRMTFHSGIGDDVRTVYYRVTRPDVLSDTRPEPRTPSPLPR